jgi:uncharacterized damage-inducible protein DinB
MPTELSATVRQEYVHYFRHLAERVEKAARALPKDKLYIKPFIYGNSMGHLLLHLTGNLNHYLGAKIAGTGYVRNRPLEFTEPNPPSPDVAVANFRAAVELAVKTFESQSDVDLSKPFADNQPIQTRFGMFLVCLAHLNNHIGQMAWLVQAMGYSTNEPPVW